MYKANKDIENEILKLAIEAFKKNVPLQFKIEPLAREPRYNLDFRPDMELDMEINGKEIRYCAEIKNNSGTLYDAEAVDACLRLFREKGFQVKDD